MHGKAYTIVVDITMRGAEIIVLCASEITMIIGIISDIHDYFFTNDAYFVPEAGRAPILKAILLI